MNKHRSENVGVSLPSISVIICAYTEQRWEELLAAVRSVMEQSLPPEEIIVVIDHNDNLLQRVRAVFPMLMIIPNAGHRGLSAARNTGVTAAHGDVVAFLDDDAVAEKTWLAHLQMQYETDDVLGVGGAITPCWTKGRPSWFPVEFDWVVGCTYRGMPRTAALVRNLIGASMSLRRCVIAELGGFRSGIGRVGTRPFGCEETELCIRATQSRPNSLFIYEPCAKVRHHVAPTRATWGYFRARCYAEGLSKALVTSLVGSREGLSSEWEYTLRTLPLGMMRGIGDGLRGDLAGFARAAAILFGLATTVCGYAVGRATAYHRHKPHVST